MAKIQDLNVQTIKIVSGAISQFFSPYSGTLGTNKYVDVIFEANTTIPMMIWVTQESGVTNLHRDYGGSNDDNISTVSGQIRAVYGDIYTTAGTITYSLVGSGDGQIVGALKRYK